MDHSDKPMRYPGPLDLSDAHTQLNHVVRGERSLHARRTARGQ